MINRLARLSSPCRINNEIYTQKLNENPDIVIYHIYLRCESVLILSIIVNEAIQVGESIHTLIIMIIINAKKGYLHILIIRINNSITLEAKCTQYL